MFSFFVFLAFVPRDAQESAKYLAASPYIRNLAMLVIAYGMSINIVEVSRFISLLIVN